MKKINFLSKWFRCEFNEGPINGGLTKFSEKKMTITLLSFLP